MKKQFYLLANAILLFGMTACEKNDDGGGAKEVVVTATVTYAINGGADKLSVFTISATYTDATGNEATEAVTSLPWTKTVEKITVPSAVSLKVGYAKKADIPDKEVYALGENLSLSYTTTDGQSGSDSSNSTISILKNKLEDYIDAVINDTHELKYEINLSK